MEVEAISDAILEESVWSNEEKEERDSLLSSLAQKCSELQIHIVPCHHSTKEKPSPDSPIRFSGKGSSWKNSHIECEVEKKFQTKDGKVEVDAHGSVDNHNNYSAEVGAKINY